MSEVEETLKRINSHKGVVGIVIVTADCVPVRSTLDEKQSKELSGSITFLVHRARSAVRSLDPQNDLTFLRIRSKKHEILVAPDKVRPSAGGNASAAAAAAPAVCLCCAVRVCCAGRTAWSSELPRARCYPSSNTTLSFPCFCARVSSHRTLRLWLCRIRMRISESARCV